MIAGLAARCRFAAEPSTHADTFVWAADRGGDRVLALDRELYVVRALEVGAPCELEVADEGLVWVLRSLERRAGARSELVLLDENGGVHARAQVDAGRELVSLRGRRAALLVRSPSEIGQDELVLVERDGTARVVFRRAGLSALSARGRILLVGTVQGELSIWRVGRRVRRIAQCRSPDPIVDLVSGPRAGSWLVLARGPDGCRIEARDRELRCVWTRELAVHATRWIAGNGSRRAWLAIEDEAACLAIGARGAITCFRASLPLVPAGGGLALDDGGALLVHSGAILALDADGRTIPGQAGFQELTDLAPTISRP